VQHYRAGHTDVFSAERGGSGLPRIGQAHASRSDYRCAEVRVDPSTSDVDSVEVTIIWSTAGVPAARQKEADVRTSWIETWDSAMEAKEVTRALNPLTGKYTGDILSGVTVDEEDNALSGTETVFIPKPVYNLTVYTSTATLRNLAPHQGKVNLKDFFASVRLAKSSVSGTDIYEIQQEAVGTISGNWAHDVGQWLWANTNVRREGVDNWEVAMQFWYNKFGWNPDFVAASEGNDPGSELYETVDFTETIRDALKTVSKETTSLPPPRS